MESNYFKNIENFFVAGINYKKSDASIRGQFAVNANQYSNILQKAALQGLMNCLFYLPATVQKYMVLQQRAGNWQTCFAPKQEAV
jgi:hypothetical protein